MYNDVCSIIELANVRQSSAQQIYETLAGRITRWEMPSGTRVTEQGLSEEFGVSRSPIREALLLLEQAGYMERAVPRGYVVRALDLARIDDIYTVRIVLEELSVELAASAAGSSRFEDFRKEVASACDRGRPELREDFHEKLAELGGNEEVLKLLRGINSKIFAFRRLDSMVSDRASAAQREHVNILDLLTRGLVDDARQAMRAHIRVSQSTVRSLMNAGVTTLSFRAISEEAAAGTSDGHRREGGGRRGDKTDGRPQSDLQKGGS